MVLQGYKDLLSGDQKELGNGKGTSFNTRLIEYYEDGLEEDMMFKLAIEYNYIFDQFAL